MAPGTVEDRLERRRLERTAEGVGDAWGAAQGALERSSLCKVDGKPPLHRAARLSGLCREPESRA